MNLNYRLEVIKQLKRLPEKDKKKVVKKIMLLQNNPHLGKALKGELEGLNSLRAWPYRIIYEIHDSVIVIRSVIHRQSAY